MATATGILASGFEQAMRETENDAKVFDRDYRSLRRLIKEEAKNYRKLKHVKKKSMELAKKDPIKVRNMLANLNAQERKRLEKMGDV